MNLKLLKLFIDRENNVRYSSILYAPKDQPIEVQYFIKETKNSLEGLNVSWSRPIRLINLEEMSEIKQLFKKIKLELLYNVDLQEVLDEEGIQLFTYKWQLNCGLAERNREKGIC
jgi:hypothetical protein